MANAQKGEFELTIGGKALTLKVGTAALVECQETLADAKGNVPSLPDIFQQVFGAKRLKYVVAFLWAGLQRYHPEYTLKSVNDLLDDASEAESAALLQKLGAAVVPDPKDAAALAPRTPRGKKANPQTAQAATSGTGDGSTSRPDAAA